MPRIMADKDVVGHARALVQRACQDNQVVLINIHDNPGVPGGIDLDEGSGFIEVTGNVVYHVRTPMNYNNRNQNRIATCNEHDNFFGVVPGSSPEIEKIIAKAGLMPEYRDLQD